MSGHMPGFGDSATWPAIGNHGDPRNDDEPVDEVDKAQNLIAEIRKELDRAERAVFKRDDEDYSLAMLNVHDLAGSLFE